MFSISSSVAGSTVASMMQSLLVSIAVEVYGLPIGFKEERTTSPVSGILRTGAASEYTTMSTWPRSSLIISITFSRHSFEKASALMLFAYKPSSFANLVKAAELYQPALPGLFSVPGFSKNTPKVAAPAPNAAEILEASP